MACTAPLDAWRVDGAITFKPPNGTRAGHKLKLPCGQCMDCRLERARQMAVRATHEAQLHTYNWFATLTYDELHVPRELDHTHWQLFMKRLRKRFGPVRYLMCGEYGETTLRPHFHACLFGLPLTDLKRFSTNKGNTLYASETLALTWGQGFVTVGALTFQSAQYVASYCTKKITGQKAKSHYTRLEPETGEIFVAKPEYSRMSLKPGIGANWIKKFATDVYVNDRVTLGGHHQGVPRYYNKLLATLDPQRAAVNKIIREERIPERAAKSHPKRLEAQAKITASRMQLKRRTLE